MADVAGVRPILKELKKRETLGPAPAGILSHLYREEWVLTEVIIEATKSEPDFIRGVLMESEGKGWVEKQILGEDTVQWRLKDYRYPARDAFVAYCGSPSPLEALERLVRASECCNLLYLVLDYQVDTEFMDMCVQNGVGLLIHIPRNGYFREVIPAEHREITDRKAFMSLGEKILFENYVLRQDEGI